MNQFKYIFLFFLLLLNFGTFSQENYDVREFDKKEIKELKKKDAYDYHETISEEEEAEESEEAYSNSNSESNFVVKLFNGIGSYIAYFVLIIIVILLLSTITGSEAFSFTSSGDDPAYSKPDLENLDEITEIEIQEYLNEALKNKDFRGAVRYHYLMCLKKLSLQKIILWKPDKTNRDYLYEITIKNLKTGFENITFHFDYVWYGGLNVDEPSYQFMKEDFVSFEKSITQLT